MPYILRPYEFRAKDPETGWYLGQNIIADESTEEKLARINESVRAGQEILDDIPADWVKLFGDLVKYGAPEIGSRFFRQNASGALRGVQYSRIADELNGWHVEGTATGASFFRLFYGADATYFSELPEEIVPGNVIYMIVETTDPGIKVYLSQYKNNSASSPTYATYAAGAHAIEIVPTCTGMQLRIDVAQGTTVNGDIKITLLAGPTASAQWRRE